MSKYFREDDLADSVWLDKYALKDDEGNLIEDSPDDMHKRMAKEFARIEKSYDKRWRKSTAMSEKEIYNLFKDFKKIIPQGSVMSQLGNPFSFGSLSNCIVLPEVHDSYGGILAADEGLAQLMKRRCGVGVDISTLRPASSKVSNAARTSTGAVSFMERFSNTTREVAQDGRKQ